MTGEQSGTETPTEGGRGTEAPLEEEAIGTEESAVADTGTGKPPTRGSGTETQAASVASEDAEELVCLALWRRKYDGSAKVREQMSHLYGLSPVCALP